MPADETLSRREFLGRAAKAGVCLAAAGTIAYATHDPAGPGPAAAEPPAATLPDFSIFTAYTFMSPHYHSLP